jgi:two-component system OmpR family response regulator
MRLMLLEDDALLGEGLRDYLRSEGHVVEWFTRLRDAQAVVGEPFDALLVDWQLPDGSGVEWIRRLRDRKIDTPVLVLTARDLLSDRIQGLDSGADDYLVKPFEPEELVARIRAVRRRLTGQGTPRLRFGAVEVDTNQRTAYLDQRRVDLTPREWAVLDALVSRSGRIVSKQDLETLVAGLDGDISSNTLEVHIFNLRRKLGRSLVENVRGHGYRIAP